MIRFASRYTLYRAFNANGELLYIGVTSDFKSRRKQHKITAPWRKQAATWTTEYVGCHFSDAITAERRAIVAEQPRYNCALHRFTPGSFVGDGGPERGAPFRSAERRMARIERGAA